MKHGAAAAARPDLAARRWACVTIAASSAGFAGALVFSIHRGFSALHLGLFAAMYALTAFGVEGGLHRHFAHRAFRAGPRLSLFLGIAGSMAAQGPVLFWVSLHRQHHAYADREGDPHSPRSLGVGRSAALRGFLHAHVGWMFSLHCDNRTRFVRDLLGNQRVWVVDRHYGAWVLIGLLLPSAAGWAATGRLEDALGGFLWGGLARIFVLDHVTWAVNSLGHTLGSRPHRVGDRSGNLAALAIASAGGAWHNNHHAQPALAHNGHSRWQIDPTGSIIRLLDRLGVVDRVRYPARLRSSQNERRT